MSKAFLVILFVAAWFMQGCNAKRSGAVWNAEYDGLRQASVEKLESCLTEQKGYESHEMDPSGVQLNRHHEYIVRFSDSSSLLRAMKKCTPQAGKGIVLEAEGNRVKLTQ